MIEPMEKLPDPVCDICHQYPESCKCPEPVDLFQDMDHTWDRPHDFEPEFIDTKDARPAEEITEAQKAKSEEIAKIWKRIHELYPGEIKHPGYCMPYDIFKDYTDEEKFDWILNADHKFALGVLHEVSGGVLGDSRGYEVLTTIGIIPSRTGPEAWPKIDSSPTCPKCGGTEQIAQRHVGHYGSNETDPNPANCHACGWIGTVGETHRKSETKPAGSETNPPVPETKPSESDIMEGKGGTP
jgi:hypothetical protein